MFWQYHSHLFFAVSWSEKPSKARSVNIFYCLGTSFSAHFCISLEVNQYETSSCVSGHYSNPTVWHLGSRKRIDAFFTIFLHQFNLSSILKEGYLISNGGFILDGWFFRKERVCNQPRDKIVDEISKRTVSWVFHLTHILWFIINCFYHWPFS